MGRAPDGPPRVFRDVKEQTEEVISPEPCTSEYGTLARTEYIRADIVRDLLDAAAPEILENAADLVADRNWLAGEQLREMARVQREALEGANV